MLDSPNNFRLLCLVLLHFWMFPFAHHVLPQLNQTAKAWNRLVPELTLGIPAQKRCTVFDTRRSCCREWSCCGTLFVVECGGFVNNLKIIFRLLPISFDSWLLSTKCHHSSNHSLVFLQFRPFRLTSSSQHCLGVPTRLLVLVVGLSPGFYLAAFFVHLASECDAILMANLHFILLWVSIQHGMLAARILSSASRVLLLMYSMQSSSSVSAVSMSSSG